VSLYVTSVIMVALPNRADHYIFILSFVLLIFLTQSQPSQIGCLPYLYTWCGLSANLRCTSETCCTRMQDAKSRQKIAICAPSHNFARLCN